MTVYHVIYYWISQTINVSSCYNFPIILVGMLQNVSQLINIYPTINEVIRNPIKYTLENVQSKTFNYLLSDYDHDV